jgi:hypothetical protein
MLRFIVLVLLAFNLGYFAWTQKALAVFGFLPEVRQEPERLQRQIEPGAIRLFSAEEAAALDAQLQQAKQASEPAQAPAPQSAGCLQSAPLTLAQIDALKNAKPSPMATWPQDAWLLKTLETPERWIIYMGRFFTEAAMHKKEGELLELKVQFKRMSEPEFLQGLSLGQFASQAQAAQALVALSRQGVRTAKIMQLNPASKAEVLRLLGVDAALHDKIRAWQPPLQGLDLQTCSEKKPN